MHDLLRHYLIGLGNDGVSAHCEMGTRFQSICYMNFVLQTGVTWLTRIDANFSSRRPEVEPTIVHVGFVVDKLVSIQVVSAYFGIPVTVLLNQYSILIFNFKATLNRKTNGRRLRMYQQKKCSFQKSERTKRNSNLRLVNQMNISK